jgi:N-acyl-D-amino-acid deacylase
VRVEDGRITEIGIDVAPRGATLVDAKDRVVAPASSTCTRTTTRSCWHAGELPKISQGVTTVVVGNCGISLAPLVHDNVPPPLNLLAGPASISIRLCARMRWRSMRRGRR